MIAEVNIPSPGESITQVVIAGWLAADGDIVSKDQEILEIDSDKATLAINAPESGKLKILIAEGETADVGALVARIDTSFAALPAAGKPGTAPDAAVELKKTPSVEVTEKEPATAPQTESMLNLSPLARKMMAENNIQADEFADFFRKFRAGREDVEFFLQNRNNISEPSRQTSTNTQSSERQTVRQKMSPLRLKLSERLVAVKNQTAMLTTFNEINMSPVMDLRNRHKEAFQKKHGVSLGFMSFFTKAAAMALREFPQVNAMIDGDSVVVHHYADIGIAVSTPKGLMVPVIRNAEAMSFAEIELKIKELAGKARDKKISPDELSGGTFTITNGGVFGSLLSTPIINPPQSAILGMHNIVERPVAVNGKVEIHPMMYVALSYDHRIIDGRESVGFLVMVKRLLENPLHMLTDAPEPEKTLLGL